MLYVVLFFTVLSFFLYVLLGGADFGAGILEMFSGAEHKKSIKKTVYSVLGPVWEANHIWIIILIVILWIAFPAFYNVVIIYLHIPLTLVLLGITLRGVAFVFRHYDAVKDKTQHLYDRMFEFSCLVTPIFLGMTFGTLLHGDIMLLEDSPNADFYALYIHPWLQPFPIFTGFFFSALCVFLSATFLIGEAKDYEKRMYMRKAGIATLVVVVLGMATLIAGYIAGNEFTQEFLSNYYALGAVTLSGLLLYPLWKSIRIGRIIYCRFFAGLQVLLILFAAIGIHYPNLIITRSGEISLLANRAPDAVISVLGISLIIGGLLIIPGLLHLLKSFRMIKILEERD
ncbi:cytochrome d ubiquinol oxidase subunit II [Flavobacterium subsaxonicum]|uniref:Cytochrome BD ubiquinol oxidase subunit II n=1 Tax=Flavobacterium subsaxonicum WB 4.1-42 = DSM 21790 TaxID=1121898 RepID=A0A0A2MI16_9FLAO|nr:cytochrome d ubiquinol oxidase subunit II [Flavobacterium subsaxonicum]KGO92282.1 cytochrome BD ubiquinol oxidase subunit II [Flavobacterium subsaxonicum WB 4.1-42 = DSM 21790]